MHDEHEDEELGADVTTPARGERVTPSAAEGARVTSLVIPFFWGVSHDCGEVVPRGRIELPTLRFSVKKGRHFLKRAESGCTT